MAALGALPPSHEPRATEFIPEMVAMIETLIARGHAYAAEGHVLFSVASFPEYGRFANRSLDEMRAGARVEVAPYKRDPMDFVLWKPSDPGLPGWDSPWGRGRPGWHIECSAMSHALLGGTFDIHGGGIDLVFPHHENEIAQSRCAHPGEAFANIWMHNGFVQVEGEKMSKSLGNFFTVRDLLDRGIPAEVIRFVLLSTHYRQPLDWTEAKVEEATRLLDEWTIDLIDVEKDSVAPELIHAIGNDVNTPLAIKSLSDLAKQGRWSELKGSLDWLGLELKADEGTTQAFQFLVRRDPYIETVESFIDRRQAAKSAKDFEAADRIRERLLKAGVTLEDRRDGTVTYKFSLRFDADALEAMKGEL
jgi:cysteinyl-tRNA synthetase